MHNKWLTKKFWCTIGFPIPPELFRVSSGPRRWSDLQGSPESRNEDVEHDRETPGTAVHDPSLHVQGWHEVCGGFQVHCSLVYNNNNFI